MSFGERVNEVKAAGYPHYTAVRPTRNREPQRLPSFEDALMTWGDGEDIVTLTLTTGEKVSGALQMSHDGLTAWLVGEYKYVDAGRSYRLVDTERERGIRTAHIISVEQITEVGQ